MVIVTARVVFQPEKRAEGMQAVAGLLAPTREEQGCISYAWYVDSEDPNVLSTIEQWESAEQVEAHMATPHVTRVLELVPNLVAAPPEITVHEVAGSRTL